MNASDPDTTRSALGRLVIEHVAIPSSLLPGLNVRIEPVDDSRFRAVVTVQGETTPVTATVDEVGRVKEYSLLRWGNQTEDGHSQFIPYDATVEDEGTYGGYTIPSVLRVGWWFGTERYLEVIRLRLESAELT